MATATQYWWEKLKPKEEETFAPEIPLPESLQQEVDRGSDAISIEGKRGKQTFAMRVLDHYEEPEVYEWVKNWTQEAGHYDIYDILSTHYGRKERKEKEGIIPATWVEKKKEYEAQPEKVTDLSKESKEFRQWLADRDRPLYEKTKNVATVLEGLSGEQAKQFKEAYEANPDYINGLVWSRQGRRYIAEKFAQQAAGKAVWEDLPEDIKAQQEEIATLWNLGGTATQRKQLQALEDKRDRIWAMEPSPALIKDIESEIMKLKSEMKPVAKESLLGMKEFLYPYKTPADEDLTSEEKKVRDDVYAYMEWLENKRVYGGTFKAELVGKEPQTSLTDEQKAELQKKDSSYLLGSFGRIISDEIQRYDTAARRIVNENAITEVAEAQAAKLKEIEDALVKYMPEYMRDQIEKPVEQWESVSEWFGRQGLLPDYYGDILSKEGLALLAGDAGDILVKQGTITQSELQDIKASVITEEEKSVQGPAWWEKITGFIGTIPGKISKAIDWFDAPFTDAFTAQSLGAKLSDNPKEAAFQQAYLKDKLGDKLYSQLMTLPEDQRNQLIQVLSASPNLNVQAWGTESEELKSARENLPMWRQVVGGATNPLWYIPISGGATLVADLLKTTKLAKPAIAAAKVITAAEKGLAYPITKPMGKAAGLVTKSWQAGIKRLEQAQIKHLAETYKFLPMMDVEKEIFKPTLMRRASSWIAEKLPGTNYLIRVANPTYGVVSDIFKAYTVRGVWQVQLMGRLEQDLAKFAQYDFVKLLGIKKGITKWGMPAGDLIEHIETYATKYKIPEATATLCKSLRDDIVGKWANFYTAAGGVINEKAIVGGAYFPRFAISKNDIELTTRFGTLRFGAKPSSLKPRYYQDMADGIARNVGYLDDPLKAAAIYSRAMGQAGLDKMLTNQMYAEGYFKKITDAIPAKLIIERDAARKFKNAQDYMLTMVKRAERGEKLHPSSWKALTAINADIAKQLKGAEGKATFKVIKDSIKDTLSAAQSRYISAQRAYTRGITGVKASANEVSLAPWAFSGHIASPEVATEISKYFTVSPSYKYVKGFNNYFNRIVRFAQTGFDFGVGHIQLLPMLVIRPDWWVKTELRSLKFMMSPRALAEFWSRPAIDSIRREMIDVAHMELGRAAAEMVEAAGSGTILDKLPVVGKVGDAFARQFSSSIDLAKFYTYKGLRGLAKGDTAKLAVIGDFTDKLFGTFSTTKIGMSPLHSELEAALLYAPRYLRAYLGLFTDIFQGGLKGRLALGAIGSVLTGMTMDYYLLNQGFKAIGWTDKDAVIDPREGAKAFTIEFNENAPPGFRNRHVGLGSNWVSLFLRLPLNIYKQATEEPESLIKFNWNDNALLKAFRGKSSVFMGSAIDILTKRNYFGELLTIPENAKAEFLTTITPFWMEFEMEDNALLPQVTMHPAELLGFRNWSVQQYEILNEGLDKATAKWCKDNGYPAMTWKEADTNNKYIQMEVLKANPDLVKAQEESWEHWAKNNPDDKSVLYKQASEFAQLTYVNELERVSQMLLDGKITVREWRDKLSDAGTAYGGALTSLQEEYKGVFAKWDEYKRDVPELSFNEAYHDYIERVIAPTFLDMNGDFSWDKKEEAKRTFVAEWGMDTVRKIEEIFDYNRGTPELVKIKKNLQDRLKPYWDIRPEGYNAAERRENLRRTDPFIDAALTFLGYVSMPLTNDGDIVLDSLVNITGVPYDSIYGEGTTPEILKLLRGYESLETQEEKRQFRRENPSLEIWGVNNRGWKSIKQQDKEAGYVD